MIKVVVLKEEKMYLNITILGHAMYDDYGKDIVCSAVSSIITTSINGILSLNKNALEYRQEKDGLVITNIKKDSVTQTLIENMMNLLLELAQSYPKNIQIK